MTILFIDCVFILYKVKVCMDCNQQSDLLSDYIWHLQGLSGVIMLRIFVSINELSGKMYRSVHLLFPAPRNGDKRKTSGEETETTY